MQTYTKNLNVDLKQKRRFSDDEEKSTKFKNSGKRIHAKPKRSNETFYENQS